MDILVNVLTADHHSSTIQIMEKKLDVQWDSTSDFIDFKRAYDSVKRVVLGDILIEFGNPMNLVRWIKMCLNKIYSKVRK
jgi:hypothetical protein